MALHWETSPITREMQIKTTMRYYFIPVRRAIINKSINKCWQGCGERGRNPSSLLEIQQPLWKTVWSFPQKFKNRTPFDPAIPLLRIYPKETWNTNLKEHKHPYVHCSIIYNSQDLEAAQMSISKWADKTLIVHLHGWMLLSYNKRRKFYPLWQHGWTWRALCWVKYQLVRERQAPYDFTAT